MDDLDIYKYYLTNFSINTAMFSPFRQERTPSFYIFQGSDGKYKWKDFGYKEGITGGNGVKLVMELFGLSYESAKQKISSDLSGLTAFIGLPNKISGTRLKKELNIKIKIKSFTREDLQYWDQFGISEKLLNKYEVFSISHYWFDDDLFNVSPKKLCFAYHFNGKFKIYMPYSEYKWFNNCSNSTIQGYNQLEESNILVITKALKDVMTLRSFSIQAIAPQCEVILFESHIIKGLNSRFSKIYTLFDNDSTGLSLAKEYKDKYSIDILQIPKPIKDVSDYYKENGREKTNELLIKLNLK